MSRVPRIVGVAFSCRVTGGRRVGGQHGGAVRGVTFVTNRKLGAFLYLKDCVRTRVEGNRISEK